MLTDYSTRWLHYALLTLAALPLFFWNLGDAKLWDLDEGRNATCALEMYTSGDYVKPTYNGELRPHKPVLQYWLVVGAYHLFGVGEFAARFPSAICAWLGVLVAYELARSLFGKGTGLLAGLVHASTPMLCGAARFANPDAILNLANLLTLLAFWQGQRNPRALWYALTGAGMGIAVLAKGPVGIIIPGSIMFFFLFWERNLKLLLDRRVLWTLLGCFLVAGPWYIMVTVVTKTDFIKSFVLTHNVDRFINPMENHRGSVLYYPLVLLVGLAPWSIFLGWSLWVGLWSAIQQPMERFRDSWELHRDTRVRGDVAAYRLVLVWLTMYLIFFTAAATKLPNYVLPMGAPCCMLIARFLHRWRLAWVQVPAWFFPTCFATLLLIGVGFGMGIGVAAGWGDFAFLKGHRFPYLWPYLWLAVAPALAGIVGWLLYFGDRRKGVLWCMTLGAVAFVAPIFALANAALNEGKPPEPLAQLLSHLPADREYVLVGYGVEHLPSLNFYVRRDMIHVRTDKELIDLLARPMPVYAFVAEHRWKAFRAAHPDAAREFGEHFDLYKRRRVILTSNR